MKTPVCLLLLLFGYFRICAQVSFSSSDLLSQPGMFYRAYANTSETDASPPIGSKVGPQRWDFSESQTSAEEVWRVDIVTPSDGGHGTEFPNAAYAERTTRESSGKQSWSYYGIVPGQGRAYYGFFDPIGNAADPLTVFDALTFDLPASITYGQKWQRTVDFQDVIDAGFGELTVVIHFTSEAVVDAYGTLVLPGIGEVGALRVNEVNSYQTQDITLGLPLGTQYFRNYYWLVKGIGKAVHIISKTDTSVPPENFKTASTVLRVFESSAVKPVPTIRSVTGLTLAVKGQELFLSWDRDPSAVGYRVEFAAAVPSAAWQTLQETKDNFLFTPRPVDLQRFFRVLVKQ